jgi:hypothetical protein
LNLCLFFPHVVIIVQLFFQIPVSSLYLNIYLPVCVNIHNKIESSCLTQCCGSALTIYADLDPDLRENADPDPVCLDECLNKMFPRQIKRCRYFVQVSFKHCYSNVIVLDTCLITDILGTVGLCFFFSSFTLKTLTGSGSKRQSNMDLLRVRIRSTGSGASRLFKQSPHLRTPNPGFNLGFTPPPLHLI